MSLVTVVVPTVGRPSLRVLLDALGTPSYPVLVVDDRRRPSSPLDVPGWVSVIPGPGRGPAAARNVGWKAAATPWVAFLDDDVLPPATWATDLAADLSGLSPLVAGSQARLRVPVPDRATDWERVTAGLAGARWATADMAFRRSALVRVGGFDERFPRAYREDADLALRLLAAGYVLVQGARETTHPVRPASRRVSVRTQAGNADDALMGRLHGPGWRERAAAPPGRFRRHALVTGAGALALVGVARLLAPRPWLGASRPWFGASRPRSGAFGARLGSSVASAGRGSRRGVAVVSAPRRPGVRPERPAWARVAAGAGGAAWVAGTAEFAWARIAPGPRTAGEVATMIATSVAIPPAAVAHRVRGELRARRERPLATPGLAVLFDRDGTLIHDVPYNGDPARVEPVPGALAALSRLRAGGVPVGVVTNQSGIGRDLLTRAQVDGVNARIEELLGPFDTWQLCPHAPDAGCACRKPAPGLVLAAAEALGVPAERCVVIGDIGADVAAAAAAGARSVLVPTPVTRPEEVAAAPVVAPDLLTAVDLALGMVR